MSTSQKHGRARPGATLWCTLLTILIMLPVTAVRGASRGGDAADNCHVGTYKLADGTVVDIAPSDGDDLRWRRLNGSTGGLTRTLNGDWLSHTGWTGKLDGQTAQFGTCAAKSIRFAGQVGTRVHFQTKEAVFISNGTNLAGRLVLPAGSERIPIVVLIHGAEQDSALTFNYLQRVLPAAGVGAFVYDKRGTGASKGTYTQDFTRLAEDAVAAANEAKRLAGRRAGRLGYQGGSEGGWVAPLAASRAPVDFVIVSFGLAVSVIDEDQEEVVLEMRLKGHSTDEIAKALEVARAAETVFESGFTSGFRALIAVEAKYRGQSWFRDVHGNFTWIVLGKSEAELRRDGPSFNWGTPFRYDPMPMLSALRVPQLWVLGGKDLDAPSDETSKRLRSLIAKGLPITLGVYPNAEHGMTEFETDAQGNRLSTRYAAGYFAMLRDFARLGRLTGSYGSAEIGLR